MVEAVAPAVSAVVASVQAAGGLDSHTAGTAAAPPGEIVSRKVRSNLDGKSITPARRARRESECPVWRVGLVCQPFLLLEESEGATSGPAMLAEVQAHV